MAWGGGISTGCHWVCNLLQAAIQQSVGHNIEIENFSNVFAKIPAPLCQSRGEDTLITGGYFTGGGGRRSIPINSKVISAWVSSRNIRVDKNTNVAIPEFTWIPINWEYNSRIVSPKSKRHKIEKSYAQAKSLRPVCHHYGQVERALHLHAFETRSIICLQCAQK